MQVLAKFSRLLAAVNRCFGGRSFRENKIVQVMDNLSMHTLSTRYDQYQPEAATRLAKRFDIQHRPEHRY